MRFIVTAAVALLSAHPLRASMILPASADAGAFHYAVDPSGYSATVLRIDGPRGSEQFAFGGVDILDGFAVTPTGFAVMAGRYYGESFLRYAAYGFGGSAACPNTPMIAAGACANLLNRAYDVGELFGTSSWFVSGRYAPTILHLDDSGHLVSELFVDNVAPGAADSASFWVPYSLDLPMSGIHNPEPATMALTLGGLVTIALWRRRKA